jgi:hypothetical protein
MLRARRASASSALVSSASSWAMSSRVPSRSSFSIDSTRTWALFEAALGSSKPIKNVQVAHNAAIISS